MNVFFAKDSYVARPPYLAPSLAQHLSLLSMYSRALSPRAHVLTPPHPTFYPCLLARSTHAVTLPHAHTCHLSFFVSSPRGGRHARPKTPPLPAAPAGRLVDARAFPPSLQYARRPHRIRKLGTQQKRLSPEASKTIIRSKKIAARDGRKKRHSHEKTQC